MIIAFDKKPEFITEIASSSIAISKDTTTPQRQKLNLQNNYYTKRNIIVKPCSTFSIVQQITFGQEEKTIIFVQNY